MSKLFWFLIVSIFFIIPSFASDVNIGVKFQNETSTFSYNIEFDEYESYNSFSFEKPKDASLLYARDLNGDFVKTSIAGDYFIIYPKDTSNSSFFIEFESPSVYDNIFSEGLFSTYFSFNFELTSLEITVDLSSLDEEIVSVNPRDHTIVEEDVLLFEFDNVERETFLQVEFSSKEEIDSLQDDEFTTYMYVLLSFLILLLIFLAFFLRNYLKSIKKNRKTSEVVISEESRDEVDKVDVLVSTNNNVDSESEVEITLDTNSEKEIEKSLVSKERQLEDFLEKYLTENEREVVLVVYENEGIAQNEILNHLTSLTKSNLSKIITKLNGKHILARIRVGKINKIYLGDKLKFESNSEDNNT